MTQPIHDKSDEAKSGREDTGPSTPPPTSSKGCCSFRLGLRHAVCFLVFLGLVLAYALRVNLSVGIVSMTDDNRTDAYPVYDWDTQTTSTILSSFFWGYVVTQVPGGQIAEAFGAMYLLGGAVAVSAVFTLLTPLAAEGGWGVLCAARLMQGLGQGVVYPSVHVLLSRWAPVEERGRLATYVYAGTQVGTIIAMPVSGLLADSAGGWPSIFYVFGAVSLGWVVLWVFTGANTPAQHRWCSERERLLIEGSLGNTASKTKLATPWKSIFKSPAFYALAIVHMGQNWGFWTLLTNIPSYLDAVMDLNIKESATLSALPYLAMWLLSFVFGYVSDFLNTRKVIPLAVSRKIFNTIGHWGPAAALVGLGYVDPENQALAVGLLTVAVGLNAATYVGYQVNHIDLSPNFAGTLMGITNCLANIMSIIGPLLVGVIVPEEEKHEQSKWRIVFFITAAFYLVGNLTFILLGRAEVQPWNTPKASDADFERNGDISDTKEEKADLEKLPEKSIDTKDS